MSRVQLPERVIRLQVHGEELTEIRPDDPHVDRAGKPRVEQPVERLARAGNRQPVISSSDRDWDSDVGNSAADERDRNDNVLWPDPQNCRFDIGRCGAVRRYAWYRSSDGVLVDGGDGPARALSPANAGACENARCLGEPSTVRRMPGAARRRAISPHHSLTRGMPFDR